MSVTPEWRSWAWPAELRRAGVVGINARNLGLLFPLSPRRFYPRVDDKVLTKEICRQHGIPTPETYAIIDRYGDVRRFAELVAGRPQFVVKPARGSGGRGILVVTERSADAYQRPSGERLSRAELRYHLGTILAGLYSLGGRPDRVIVEERIDRHPIFEYLAVGGTPDIRVVVHQGEAAMAMLRLPTRASDGCANLHQGAVGAGVDIGAGETLGGVLNNEAVDTHPDTKEQIAGHKIPHWPLIVDAAERLSRALELGYVGIDIVLDSVRGPVVLEANARPGLGIQIANRCGLLSRLEKPRARV